MNAKWFYTVLMCTALASTVVQAAEIDGQWQVVERTCSEGRPASDAFQIGRDIMELAISNDVVNLHVVIASTSTDDNREGRVNSDTLSFKENPNTKAEAAEIPLSYNKPLDQLTIVTAGFGPGGSCPVGSTLSTIFGRK